MSNRSAEDEEIHIELDEADFAEFIDEPQIHERLTRSPVVLGPGKAEDIKQKILDAMPKVIASKVGKLIPENMELYQITLKIRFSANPLNIGIDSDATVTFGPRKNT